MVENFHEFRVLWQCTKVLFAKNRSQVIFDCETNPLYGILLSVATLRAKQHNKTLINLKDKGRRHQTPLWIPYKN